jgi:hypothetical protein
LRPIWAKKTRLSKKMPNTKKGWNCAQVAKDLSSNHETLSSNPRAKKEKKERKMDTVSNSMPINLAR